MNIATITCHDVYNVGASLQAYALAEYLRRQGHTPVIIDYKAPYLSTHYRLWGCSSPAFDRPVLRQLYSLCKLPGRIRDYFSPRKRAFDQFRAQYLPLTPQRYASAAQLEQCPPQAQVYLAGSDQIWNTRFPNGKDPAFYLTFAPSAGVRASYAASFATKEVEPEQREQVRTWLRQLDFISVRERSGVDILTRLGVAGGIQVCDPVFLLPRSHWESIAPAQPEGDYLLVYDFDRNPKVAEISRQLARERGWKIYTIFPSDYGDRCCWDCGPLEFISLVRNAQCVLSNSFHGTAFALIFQRPFLVLPRGEQINTRMEDLLAELGLSRYYLTGGSKAEQLDWAGLDWADCQRRLSEMVERSQGYLDTVLREGARRSGRREG